MISNALAIGATYLSVTTVGIAIATDKLVHYLLLDQRNLVRHPTQQAIILWRDLNGNSTLPSLPAIRLVISLSFLWPIYNTNQVYRYDHFATEFV